MCARTSELKLPIVRVTLDGTYPIWPHKSWRLHLAKIKISFGELIDAREVAPDENDNQIVYEKVTAAVNERIRGSALIWKSERDGFDWSASVLACPSLKAGNRDGCAPVKSEF